MPRPACEEALTIPELLEGVLIHLSPQELLISAQRVNKQWHHVITNSLPILLHLHLAADETQPSELEDNLSRPSRYSSDLLIRNFHSYYTERHLSSVTTTPPNPSILHPTASWHSMHVTQPPIYKLAIFHCHHHFSHGPDLGFMHHPTDPDWTIIYPDGLRMIDLFYRCRDKIPLAATHLPARGVSLTCNGDEMEYLFSHLCRGITPRPYPGLDNDLAGDEWWWYDQTRSKVWYWADPTRVHHGDEKARALSSEVDACIVFYSGDITGFPAGLMGPPQYVKKPWPDEERGKVWQDPDAWLRGGFGGT